MFIAFLSVIQYTDRFFTGYADYILMAPLEAYAFIMDTMKEKIYLSKVVIEFLHKNQEATYEDLLNKLQVRAMVDRKAKQTRNQGRETHVMGYIQVVVQPSSIKNEG